MYTSNSNFVVDVRLLGVECVHVNVGGGQEDLDDRQIGALHSDVQCYTQPHIPSNKS